MKTGNLMFKCLGFSHRSSRKEAPDPFQEKTGPRFAGTNSALKGSMAEPKKFSLASQLFFYLAFALFAQLGTSQAAQAAGGEGGGGGNPESSSATDVQSFASASSSYLYSYLNNIRIDLEKGDTDIEDPKLRKIFRRIFAKVDLKKLENRQAFVFKLDGPCKLEKNINKAASSVVGDPNTPICLSVPELQRIPRHQLDTQVFGLLGHEIAHQAGYGEEEAEMVQKFLLSRRLNQEGRTNARSMLSWSLDAIYQTLALVRENAPQVKVCAALGKAIGYAKSASHMGFAIQPVMAGASTGPGGKALTDLAIHISYIVTNGSGEKDTKFYDVLTYCGLPMEGNVVSATHPEMISTVREGNRDELVDALTNISNNIEAIRSKLPY